MKTTQMTWPSCMKVPFHVLSWRWKREESSVIPLRYRGWAACCPPDVTGLQRPAALANQAYDGWQHLEDYKLPTSGIAQECGISCAFHMATEREKKKVNFSLSQLSRLPCSERWYPYGDNKEKQQVDPGWWMGSISHLWAFANAQQS